MSEKKGLFISDFGREVEFICENEVRKLPRYGVWVYDSSKGKPQVAETSNDLEYLIKKYKVDPNNIAKI